MSDYQTEQLKRQKEEFDRSQRELSQRRNEESRNTNNGGSNGCFSASTLVHTPSGEVRIENISIGQEIFSWDTRAQKVRLSRVTSHKVYEDVQIIRIQLGDELIETTKDHPFLTEKGWTQTKNIKPGDKLLKCSGRYSKVSSILVTERYEATHNLIVEGYANYMANGFVVNSFCHFWSIRSLISKAGDRIRTKTKEPLSAF